MRRNTLNFIIDAAIFLMLLGLILTGLLIRFVLPPGSGGRHGGEAITVWSGSRHDWGGIHFWIAAVMVGLLCAHMVLHWNWVCATVRRWGRGVESSAANDSPSTCRLYGVGVFSAAVLIMAGLLYLAADAARHSDRQEYRASITSRHPEVRDNPFSRGQQEPDTAGESIRGSMTLREVSTVSDVPLDVICNELGLPASVDTDERLGRLRRRYAFDMSTLRTIVSTHQGRSTTTGTGN